MYRRIRQAQNVMEALHAHVRAAILSTNTRDAIGHAGAAQEAAAVALRDLDDALRSGSSGNDAGVGRIDRLAVLEARSALSLAVEGGERVALGSNIEEMRGRLIDLKTQVDFADAFLRTALGLQRT